jgi:hypothetical protein
MQLCLADNRGNRAVASVPAYLMLYKIYITECIDAEGASCPDDRLNIFYK